MLLKSLAFAALALLAAAPLAAQVPADIKWETNMDDPPIGSPEAKRGGTFNYFMDAYPLTLRLMGPNANDAFAGWNRCYSMDFALVTMHPSTDNFIPWMATHWSVQEDNRTVYYKLDPDARWSDGKPVTAEDFVFTYEMMKSPHIVDPFYKDYAETYFESVEAVEPGVVKIVGKKPSWRPLSEYNLWPSPRHVTKLDENWVRAANNVPQVVPGPYTITKMDAGKSLTFTRVKDWWGDEKHYMKGMYNPDEIVLKVIPQERALDYFKNGEIDIEIVTTARIWAQDMNFDSLQKNWVRRYQVFVDAPVGVYGFAMNLTAPFFKDKNVRKAMQHLFNFEELNKNLMFEAYYRQVSAFEGTEYANPNLKPYPFDPRKAREFLAAAGYNKRGTDGILTNAQGQRAEFTLIYGTKPLERHLTTVQQTYRKAGVDMKLQLLESATAFERGLERKYEMTTISRTANLYPSPRQYFHSEFLATTNNNNIWAFGTPETDKLIETYLFDLNKENRIAAMHKLDEIIQEEAFYIPWWNAPYIRVLSWDYVQWPDYILPKRTQQFMDYQVFWVDEDRRTALKAAMQKGEALPEGKPLIQDAWGIRKRLLERSAPSGS